MKALFYFLPFAFGFSVKASDVSAYNNVSNFQEALKIVEASNDANVLLVGSQNAHFGQVKSKEVWRGNGNYIDEQGKMGLSFSWPGLQAGNADFANKPASMSVKEFLQEASNTLKGSFDDDKLYYLSLNRESGKFLLKGPDFEVSNLTDGSVLIFLHKQSSESRREFETHIK